MKRIKDLLDKYGRILTGLGILICVAGLVIGYIKPKQKLETMAINMDVIEDADIAMEQGMVVDYVCSTKGYPMAGIQVGVCKYGQAVADGALLCRVYDESKTTVLSQTLISVGELDEGQYVYIPFENYKECNGTICVEFTYTGTEKAGLLVNKAAMEDAKTYVDGQESEYMLKSYYVYKLDYYPLVFDLCTVLCLLLGVFFLSGQKKDKGETQDEQK